MPNDAERSLMIELEAAVERMLRGEPVNLAADATLSALMGIASDLRDLPREDFLARLGRELNEEGEHMSATATKTVREGFGTVTPYIVVNEATQLADFIKNAFGAEETLRAMGGSGGGFHMEFRLGHSMLMVGGGGAYKGPELPPSLHYFVHDVDNAYKRAIAAGATAEHEPVDQPYGVREASIRYAGVDWYLSTPMKAEGGREVLGVGDLAAYLHPRGADGLIEFMKRAFGAEELESYREPAGSGPIVHAKVRIEDSIVELGEAHGKYGPKPTMLFLYVDDADAWFNRAVAAGAKVTTPMGDQPYGRTGAVQDPHGNLWHLCTPAAPK